MTRRVEINGTIRKLDMIGVKLSSGIAVFYEEGIPREVLKSVGVRPATHSEILNYYERCQHCSHPYILDSIYIQEREYDG